MSRNTVTWQNVTAPDVSGYLKAAGASIDSAGNTFDKSLGYLDTARKDGAAAAILQQAMRYQDPAALQQAMASGALTQGIDPRYAATAIKPLNEQLAAAFDQQNKSIALDTEKARLDFFKSDLDFKKTTQQRALDKEIIAEKDKAVMFDYARLVQDGDPIQLAAFHNEHRDTFSRMGEAGAPKIAQGTNLVNDKLFAQQVAPMLTASNPWDTYQGIRAHLSKIKDPILKAQDEKKFAELGWDITKPENVVKWQKADEAIKANAPATAALQASVTGSATGTDPVDNVWSSLINRESGGRQFDKNGKPLESTIIRNGVKVPGAIGIAQVMEATGPDAAKMAGVPWDKNLWLHDEAYNEKIGKAYLRNLYTRYGDMPKALAAYNGGMGRVDAAVNKAKASGRSDAWLEHMPEETRKYVPAIMQRSHTAAAGVLNGTPPVSATPATTAFSSKAEEMFAPDVAGKPTGSVNQDVPAAEQLFADAAPAPVRNRVSPPVTPGVNASSTATENPALTTPEIKRDSSSTAVLTALEQAVRNGNRGSVLGLAESSAIGQIAVNSAKRSNTDAKANVDYVRDRVSGDGKNFREDDLRNLYVEFTTGVPENKKPTLSQFTEMLTMSIKRGNAIDNLAFSGDVLSDVRSIIPGDLFTSKEYRFSPKTLKGYIGSFDAGHVSRINELLTYAGTQASDSKKVDASLEDLEKTVKNLTRAATADPDRFGYALATARQELADAQAKSDKLGRQTRAVQ